MWFGYFWPSLQGNGPEALVQTVVYGAVAVVVWPPARKAIERFAKRHADDLKAHVEAEQGKLHAKLDHIISESPDIPPFNPEKKP
jgi:hypothetical protein